jgi:hypothetical protein
MPRGVSKKVKIRAEEVAHVLRVRGCIMVRALVEAGFTRVQAEQALRYLSSNGRAVHVAVGRIALWCYSRKSAARHLARLRRALHRAVCAAGMKYVSPRDAFEAIVKDKAARRVFARYTELSEKNTALLHLLSGILTSMYVLVRRRKRGRMPIFFACCQRKKLPPKC